MSHRRQTTAKILMGVLLGVVLLLLVSAVTWPDSAVRRVLFAVVLLAAVALLLLCIIVGFAQLEMLRTQLAVARRDREALRAQMAAHIAGCEADREARRMGAQLVSKMFEPRSA